jgi:hypothetical protein
MPEYLYSYKVIYACQIKKYYLWLSHAQAHQKHTQPQMKKSTNSKVNFIALAAEPSSVAAAAQCAFYSWVKKR